MVEQRNIYKGHRYVPKIMGEWNQTESYEGLSIVTNQGDSYTSKKRVPTGIELSNQEYWVNTANFNAQIEQYRNEVKENTILINDYFEKNNKTMLPAKMIGLIENSLNESLNNYQKLHQALLDGNTILIDGDYFISGNNETVIENPSFIGKGGKLISDNTTSFNFDGNLFIDKVNFEFDESIIPLFSSNTLTTINDIIITNNNISGNGLLLDINLPTTKKMVKNIIINNNIVNNTKNHTFRLNNVDFNILDVRHNTVHNMDRQLFNLHSMGNNESIINIMNNVVINDLDFWGDVGGNYLCFLLYAGFGKLNYVSNIVDGLKTKLPTTSVYDSYLSATIVNYKNNTWKDNISVNSSKVRNSLFKAKGGEGILFRSVINNNFTVSSQLINLLTETEKANAWVTMWDFERSIQEFVYENNTIDVYYIKNKEYDTSEKVIFNHNTIKTKHLDRVIVNFIGTGTSEINVANNVIDSSSSTVSNFFAQSSYPVTTTHKKVDIIDNIITMNFDTLLFTLNADVLNFHGNTITNLNTATSRVMNYNTIKTLKGSNNVIDNIGNIETFGIHSLVTKFDYHQTSNKNTGDSWNIALDSPVEKMIVFKDAILTNDGEFVREYIIKTGIDETGRYLKYKNTSNVEIVTYVNGNYPTYGTVISKDNKNFQMSIVFSNEKITLIVAGTFIKESITVNTI